MTRLLLENLLQNTYRLQKMLKKVKPTASHSFARKMVKPRLQSTSRRQYSSKLFFIFFLFAILACGYILTQSVLLDPESKSAPSPPSSAVDTDVKTPDDFDAKTKNDLNTKFSSHQSSFAPDENIFRILHIVTSLSEYNNGSRNTVQGQDRLAEVLLPVLKNSVESFLSVPNWNVDVYLILGFELKPERKQMIMDALPDGVGLQVWNDAIPIGYPREQQQMTKIATHALARQHRFVIKDKLDYYDLFSAWEDDMAVTAENVLNYLEMKQQIDELKEHAAKQRNTHPVYGSLNKDQLDSLIPGFIRVEVVDSNLTRLGKSQKIIQPAPSVTIDPKSCCNLFSKISLEKLSSDRVMLWETDIKAMGVRHIPGPIGWVMFLPGDRLIPSYWSGEDGAYGKDKRPGRDGKHMAQQAGIMATKSQILHFESVCPGSYLPPFSGEMWRGQSGLKPQNVEFWSGGYQLFGRCGLQRILSLEPAKFSRQLLFHSSNNKQRRIQENRFVKAKDLLGQLHTVRDASILKHGKEPSSDTI